MLADVPGTLDTLVDEMLRYVSPVMYFRRTATVDTELRGVPIQKGQKVTVWYGAANRDEDVFADPHGFDVTRSPERAHRVRRPRARTTAWAPRSRRWRSRRCSRRC